MRPIVEVKIIIIIIITSITPTSSTPRHPHLQPCTRPEAVTPRRTP